MKRWGSEESDMRGEKKFVGEEVSLYRCPDRYHYECAYGCVFVYVCVYIYVFVFVYLYLCLYLCVSVFVCPFIAKTTCRMCIYIPQPFCSIAMIG